MASRLLTDLAGDMPVRAQAVIEECKNRGVDLLIYCTYRSLDEQAILYRQSRSSIIINAKIKRLQKWGLDLLAEAIIKAGPRSGPHVTNAAPGESYHNYGLAFDAVPLTGGKPAWEMWANAEAWEIYGIACKNADLSWAGCWENFVEYPHAQLTKAGNPLKEHSADYVNAILGNGDIK